MPPTTRQRREDRRTNVTRRSRAKAKLPLVESVQEMQRRARARRAVAK